MLTSYSPVSYTSPSACKSLQSIRECSVGWVVLGVSLTPRVLCDWLVKLKMLWLASLLIVFALLAAPNGRPASFLFFIAIVDHSSSRILFFCAPYASLSIEGIAEIGNSLNSARLAAFARTISFTLAGHSPDYNIYYPPWQAAQRLRGAGDMPAYISVL
jgi:hypothetical protein